MSWNFLDVFDIILDVFGLASSGSKSSRSSQSKPERKPLNHNVLSQRKEPKDLDTLKKK
ncbi:hypothetical protein SAMN05421593_3275 [Chryseobacterium culicis]|uniref:Uncharacterized protein n=1 Tax=Chryseobacterium culicis TaxID=680127 RepID=A0A1H6HR52_CHRCI|nr:hypothetical protein SAMN05421593_3275 [Chryseobacterium culicis]